VPDLLARHARWCVGTSHGHRCDRRGARGARVRRGDGSKRGLASSRTRRASEETQQPGRRGDRRDRSVAVEAAARPLAGGSCRPSRSSVAAASISGRPRPGG